MGEGSGYRVGGLLRGVGVAPVEHDTGALFGE